MTDFLNAWRRQDLLERGALAEQQQQQQAATSVLLTPLERRALQMLQAMTIGKDWVTHDGLQKFDEREILELRDARDRLPWQEHQKALKHEFILTQYLKGLTQ